MTLPKRNGMVFGVDRPEVAAVLIVIMLTAYAVFQAVYANYVSTADLRDFVVLFDVVY